MGSVRRPAGRPVPGTSRRIGPAQPARRRTRQGGSAGGLHRERTLRADGGGSWAFGGSREQAAPEGSGGPGAGSGPQLGQAGAWPAADGSHGGRHGIGSHEAAATGWNGTDPDGRPSLGGASLGGASLE